MLTFRMGNGNEEHDMGLPSPRELDKLSGLIIEQGKLCNGKWPKFKGLVKSIVAKIAPAAAQSGLTQGAAALGVASGLPIAGIQVAGLSAGVAFAPLGAVLAPWVGAAAIASQAGKIFALHDLRADALSRGGGAVTYRCNCGNCAKNIKYIIDKKERNVGLVAVGVATVGISSIFKSMHSIGKKVKSAVMGEQRPKELTCRGLIESSRGGCTAAMASIFLLSGSWSMFGNRDVDTMATAVAIMTSEDGWEKFQSLW